MNGPDLKEAMDQIHISEEMQEKIIFNLQNQIRNRKNSTRNRKKMTAVAAAFALMAVIIGIPVQALVQNLVTARMEEIPGEEVQNIAEWIKEQKVEADSFSREYSDSEKERMQELMQSYQNGTFPEKTILLVENADGMVEGTLCYIKETGLFCLPDREMTDEELLQIIDFNRTRSYAIEQSPAAQAAREEDREEQTSLKEQIQNAGGISEEKAVEIATAQLKCDLGSAAEGKEKFRVSLEDISGVNYIHKGNVAYKIYFYDAKEYSTFMYMIDSEDGSILDAWELRP